MRMNVYYIYSLKGKKYRSSLKNINFCIFLLRHKWGIASNASTPRGISKEKHNYAI